MRLLLLTAFEPFGGDGRNPSAEVLAAVAADPPVDGLVTEVLPVVYATAGRRVVELIERHRPAAWVGLGLHGGATAVVLERRAANWDGATLADNAGEVRRGGAIDPAGPAFRPATLPLAAMADAVAAAGVPVVFSESAGRFVCNHTFYRAAAVVPPAAGGFVHLPWPADWSSGRGHSVTFDQLRVAVRACLTVVAGQGSS